MHCFIVFPLFLYGFSSLLKLLALRLKYKIRAANRHSVGGWVGPRVSLDNQQQRKIATGIEQYKLFLCMANYAHLKKCFHAVTIFQMWLCKKKCNV